MFGIFGRMGIFGNMFGGAKLKKASKKAAAAQQSAMQKGIEEQQRQFEQTQGWFNPYLKAGEGALGQWSGLVGLGGAEQQQAAIDQLKNSPFYQSLYRTGEEAVLQNASATGGLRGGNTQHSLAEFGEDALARAIQQQMGNLGTGMQLGYGSAGQLGGLGANMSGNITDLLVGQGQSKAQDIMNRGMLSNQMWSGLGQLGLGAAGAALGMPGFGSFTSGSPLAGLFGGGGGLAGFGGIPQGNMASLGSLTSGMGGIGSTDLGFGSI